MLRVIDLGVQGYHITREGLWSRKMITLTPESSSTKEKLFPLSPMRVCQTCAYCTPKQSEGPIGLFCDNPQVLGFSPPTNSATPIFWAVLKHCGEERKYWEAA